MGQISKTKISDKNGKKEREREREREKEGGKERLSSLLAIIDTLCILHRI